MKEQKPMKSIEEFMKMRPWFESHGFRYNESLFCNGGGTWILEKGSIVIMSNPAARGKIAVSLFNREGHRPAIYTFGKDLKDAIHLLIRKASVEPLDEKHRKMINQVIRQLQD